MTPFGQLVLAILLGIAGGLLLFTEGWIPGLFLLGCSTVALVNFIKLIL